MADRFALPPSVIEDARAHPEKYREPVGDDDRILVVESAPGVDLVGVVRAYGQFDLDDIDAWLRVGGVEQGPRPEVSGRVLVLDVHLPSAEVLVGQVGRVDFVGYDAIDRLGPLVVFTEPDGTEHRGSPSGRFLRPRTTVWAKPPVIDGVAKVRQSIENAIKTGATTDQIVEVLVSSGLATRR